MKGKGTGKPEDKGRGGEAKEAAGKGKEHQQQLKAFERQIEHEEAKHSKRVARLRRIKELARKQGNDKMLARVNKLMEKEQGRYERKVQRIQGRIDKVGEPVEAKSKGGGQKSGEGRGKAKVKTKERKAEKDKGADADEESYEEDDE